MIPAGIPASLANLIQTNSLARYVSESLRPWSRYRADAKPQKLPPGIGTTQTFQRLGLIDVDLKPAPPVGSPELASFEVENYTAAPKPYAKTIQVDGPTSYVQIGDQFAQKMSRLTEWAGRTSNRLARGRMMGYFGGQSIIRRAQSSGDSILLVNSLAGFRTKHINGVPLPVSSTNGLPITIVAASTITTRKVTGVIPLDANFPDGPGELQLDGTLGAAVAVNVAGAQSYVYVQGVDASTPRPYIVRPNSKASTEALATTDLPTLDTVIAMRQMLVDSGVPPHAETGTYHLHTDAFFLGALVKDTAWRTATQGMGPSAILGPGTLFVPSLGITVIENTDAPAKGKGKELQVGAAGTATSGTGGTGTPLASRSMQDCGLDVVNSAGVSIRRAVMTGDEVMIESYVLHADLIRAMNVPVIHQYGAMSVYQLGGMQFIAGEVDRWTFIIQPPLDPRALVANITAAIDLDYVLGTDSLSGTDASDTRTLRRAVGMEWGSAI
jgi:hypothetical protein